MQSMSCCPSSVGDVALWGDSVKGASVAKNVGEFCPNFMSWTVLVSQGLKVRDKIARSARCPVKQVRSVRLLETFSPSKNLP